MSTIILDEETLTTNQTECFKVLQEIAIQQNINSNSNNQNKLVITL